MADRHSEENQREVFGHFEAEVMLRDAAEMFTAGKFKEADRIFKKLTGKFPNFYPGLAGYGDFLLQIGEPHRALEPLRAAVKLAMYEGVGHYLLGVAYLKVGRFSFAERALEMAKSILPEKGDVSAHLGRAKMLRGDLEAGRTLIQESLRADLSNPYLHMDMAQTYVRVCEFEQALNWLNSARTLDPQNAFLRENTEMVKRMKSAFGRLPAEKQAAQKKLVSSRAYQEEMRIQLLLHSLRASGEAVSQEDLWEVTEELKSAGLSGQIAMFKDPRAPASRSALAYIREHKKVGDLGRKLSSAEYRKFEAELFDSKMRLAAKKRILIRLAHQGTQPALNIIARYRAKPDRGLEIWVEMAFQECQSFLESKVAKRPAVKIHKLDG